MNSSLRRSTMRGAVVVAAAAALIGAGSAFAHVTAQPGQAPQGGYAVVTFRVPDESDTAGAEPERPAPVVALTVATGDGAMGGHDAGSAAAPAAAAPAGPTSGSDSTARWLAGGGLLVGALGVGLGAGAVLRSRRSGTS